MAGSGPVDRHHAAAGKVLDAFWPSAAPDMDPSRPGRSGADHAKSNQVSMARDVATMFEDLRAMADRYTELHTDRARLQAELEQARAELARARRRLVG
jgi:site-specific recombinase